MTDLIPPAVPEDLALVDTIIPSMELASQRALSIDKLVIKVLALLDRNDLVCSARLNRQWSDHALNNIWKYLPSIIPLLETLGPLKPERSMRKEGRKSIEEITWVAEGNILDESWQRLAYYNSKVRSLTYDDSEPFRGETAPIASSTYTRIFLHYVNREQFLGNLRSLSLSISFVESFFPIGLLLTSSVRTLDFTIAELKDCHKDFFARLQGRTKNIEALSIRLLPPIPLSIESFETPFNVLFAASPNLTSISLPQFYLSPSIVESLGSLPRLRRIGHSDFSFDAPFNADGCHFLLGDSKFPRLEVAYLQISLLSATDMLSEARRRGRLTTLSIGTRYWTPTRDMLHKFLDVLASTNPLLQQLCLNLFEGSGEAEPLNCSTLSPLQGIINLIQLNIGHCYPIRVSLGDVKWMALSWPKLDNLSLAPDPVIKDPKSPPDGNEPTVLTSFARHFPYLTSLGIYVVIEQDFQTYSSNYRFKSMESLQLGQSALVGCELEVVAAYIASLMPQVWTKLGTDVVTSRPQSIPNHWEGTWDTVRQLIPNYYRAHLGFQQRIDSLKEQLRVVDHTMESLKEENRAITQKAHLLERKNSSLKEELRECENWNGRFKQKISALERKNASLTQTVTPLGGRPAKKKK